MAFKGYEIHCGTTMPADDCESVPASLLQITADGECYQDGVCSDDGQIIGTYLHGLFDHPDATNSLLNWAGLSTDKTVDINLIREQQLDRLADAIQEHMMPEFINRLVG